MKLVNIIPVISILLLITSCNSDNTYTLKYIYDNEGVLTDEQKIKLDKLFVDHEKKTTNEIYLVTTKDYDGQENIDLFTLDFQSKHIIGKPDKNNGVLIVFSDTQSEVRITPSSGLSKMDEDGITSEIITDIMLPKFEKDENFEGLWEGNVKLVEYLEN
jgi:uncharacterized protein